MKKIFLLTLTLVFSLFCLLIFAGFEKNAAPSPGTEKEWVPISSPNGESPRVRASTSFDNANDGKEGSGEISVEFKLPGYFLRHVEEKGYVVEIPECQHTGAEGAPAVPAYLIKLALPPNAEIRDIVPDEDSSQLLSVQKLAIIEPYAITPDGTKPTAFQKMELNDYYPEKIYKFHTSKLRDGNTEGTLVIYPVQYEPGYGFILHYSISLRIAFNYRPYTEAEKEAMEPQAWKDARQRFNRLGQMNRGQRYAGPAAALSKTKKGTAYQGGYSIPQGSPYLGSLIALTTWHEESSGVIKPGIKGLNIEPEHREDYGRAQALMETFGSNETVDDKNRIYQLIKQEWSGSEAVVVYPVGDSSCEAAAAPLASYMNWPLLPYEGTHDTDDIQNAANDLGAKYIIAAGDLPGYERNRLGRGGFQFIHLKNQREINLLNTYLHLKDWENGLKDSLTDHQETFYSREIANKDFNYVYRNNSNKQNISGISSYSVTNPPSGGYLVLYSTKSDSGDINYEEAAIMLAAYRGGESINVSSMEKPEDVRAIIDEKGYKYVALMGDGDPYEVPAWDINDPVDDKEWFGWGKDIDPYEPGGQNNNNGVIYSDFYYEIDQAAYNSSHGTTRNNRTMPGSWSPHYYVGRVVGVSEISVRNYVNLIKKYELGLTQVSKNCALIAADETLQPNHSSKVAVSLFLFGRISTPVIQIYWDFTKDKYLNKIDPTVSSGVTVAIVESHGYPDSFHTTGDNCDVLKGDIDQKKYNLGTSPFLQYSNCCLNACFLGNERFKLSDKNENLYYPEETLCIGVSFISSGAIGFIGPTMLSYGNPAGSMYSHALSDLFFSSHITRDNKTMGTALGDSKKDYWAGLFDIWPDFKKKTIWEYILIGDPAVNIQMGDEQAPGENTLDDKFEENDAMSSAKSVSTGEYKDLFCKDDDWYKIYLSSYSDLRVTIYNYVEQTGNLDLYLFDSSGNLINKSTSGTDSEGVSGSYLAPGYHYFLVTGYHDARNLYSMNVEASGVNPISINISSPSNGSTVSGYVTISTNPSSNINKVEFYVDGGKVNTDYSSPFSYSWNSTQVPDGDHVLKVKGYDAKNYSVEDSIKVKVNNSGSPITCQITFPPEGQVLGGYTNINVNASHSSGIKKVEFYVDNQYKYTDYNSPYSWTWRTIDYSKGEHVALVKCFNNLNQAKTASVRVEINQPPVIEIPGYSNYQNVHGKVKIRVNVLDDEGDLQNVYFKVDGNVRFTDTTEPWEYEWDTTKETKRGSFLIEAGAYDGYWNAMASVYLSPNQLPAVSLTNPTFRKKISGATTIEASASDDYSISKVEFFTELSGSSQPVLIGTDTSSPYQANFDTAQYADGLYIVSAKAYDNINQTSQSAVPVEINNDNNPIVQVTNPSNEQTVSGAVTVTAAASDDNSVKKVEFYIDDILKSSDTTSPYEYLWETTTSPNGQHIVGAVAYDSADQAAGDLVLVNVSNSIAEPGMVVKQYLTEIPDGGSWDFGSQSVASTTDITFIIENTGTAELTLTGSPIITISGTDADQFNVQQQPTSPVAPTENTTFTLQFKPTSEGTKTALISIENNDLNKNPYDITLTGTGDISGPVIDYIEPSSGAVGTPVTISGSNFGSTQGTVTFNEINAQIGSWSDTEIITAVPDGAATGPVIVHTPDGKDSNEVTFTVTEVTGPEINIKQGTTGIPDGGTYHFGSHETGSYSDRTFTIENTGIADLVLTEYPIITITGTNTDQFSVEKQPDSWIQPGGNTTFIIRFGPHSIGEKTANISIINNDADERPYDITLKGTGASTGNIENLFFDNFESYTAGAFPSSGGWQLINSGYGYYHQWIDTSTCVSPSKSFKMEGTINWASSIVNEYQLPNGTPDTIYYEFWVKVTRLQSPVMWYPDFRFWAGKYGGNSHSFGNIDFQPNQADGNEYIVFNGETGPEVNLGQWYKIKIKYDLANDTGDVWLDDELIFPGVGLGSGSVHYFEPAITFEGGNDCHTRVWVDDVKVYIEAPTAPTLTVTSPNGGENLTLGDTYYITWDSSNVNGTLRITLWKDWQWVGEITKNINPSSGYYQWTVGEYSGGTASAGTGYRVKIREVDTDVFDTSDTSFTITAPNASSITVTSPNGGEELEAKSTHTIKWFSTGIMSNVKIQYSLNNGSSWTTITTSTTNDGIHPWVVPDVLSSQCLVKISEASTGTPSDTSDTIFSIVTPTPPQISLNRAQVFFGATTSGTATPSQTFLIDNSGGGTLNWFINDNATWLTCSPPSGSNSGIAAVSVDPSGLSAGTYTGTITVSAPGATNSPQTAAITLKVYNSGSTRAPFGEFATPLHGSTVRSSIPVTGWVVDDIGVESVKIYRKTGNTLVYIGDAIFVEGARPDVEQAYPGYPMNYKAGWGYMMLTNFLPNGGNGTFTIYAIATDREGKEVTLGSKTITCDNANAVKPFGAIDTPTQGGTASGTSFRNHGWVLTPLPNKIPEDGSTIDVIVNGVNLGHPNYNNYRSDVAQLFPGYNNSNGAHAYFDFDTTAYINGVHTIAWIAADNAGNTDGIGSRYFTVQNIGNSSSSRTSIKPSWSLGDILKIPGDLSTPAKVKKGYSQRRGHQLVSPDNKGITTIEIKELEPVEIHLRKKNNIDLWMGFQMVGKELKSLPIGSTFNTSSGVLYWQPGPGFVGDYEFLFIGKTGKELKRKHIIVKITSKFTK